MPSPLPHPRAQYDENGNIILRSENAAAHARQSRSEHFSKAETADWAIVNEESGPIIQEMPQTKQVVAKEARHSANHVRLLLGESMQETQAEWAETVHGMRGALDELAGFLRSLPAACRKQWQRLVKIATMPIELPAGFGAKRTKQRSRFQLFLTDTLRFGGTFAFIFITLFVAINYESFSKITMARLALGNDAQTGQELASLLRPAHALATDPFSASGNAPNHSLLAYLPPVGPPDNRLVIPKINENVPVIDPPMDSLLSENWKQFDADIQDALLHGAVHYPGSAHPGQAGNFFMTAHSSYYAFVKSDYKDVFARLSELEVGDTYSVYYGGDLYTYRVTDKYEVKPSDVSVLDQPTDKRISTLMTCTPVGTTLRRLIVRAVEIDPETNEPMQVGQRAGEQLKTAKVETLPI